MYSIRIAQDADSLANTAAEYVLERATAAVAERGQFSLVLSGGSTPQRLYERLAGPEFARQIDWTRAHVFWGDERCVHPDHPDSNYRMARAALLDRVSIPAANVHRIMGEIDPDEAAWQYEKTLRAFFAGLDRPRFDLILLGMGDDGHTASLFPGTPALDERSRWVVATYVSGKTIWRVTLTLPAINASRHILFLVAGEGKAGTLSAVINRGRGGVLPAQLVQPDHGELVWLVDQAAARQIVS